MAFSRTRRGSRLAGRLQYELHSLLYILHHMICRIQLIVDLSPPDPRAHQHTLPSGPCTQSQVVPRIVRSKC